MNYDINRPWLTLDPWQKEYCFDPDPNQNNFLLCPRQTGKTTAMSIRAVELCVHHYKKGEFVLINSITEKQAYHLLAKAAAYAEERYSNKIITKGKDKPTKHKLMFTNGTGILCYAAGETGEGLRGFTIKKLMPDEGSRMSEEYFIATLPMLSVIGGSMDIASTPAGKLHKDGTEKFFYKCSKNPTFKKHYVNAEDCPRHTKEFLKEAKKRMSELAYAQEFLATFTDKFREFFDEDLINATCILKKDEVHRVSSGNKYYLGVDVAGMGEDISTFESLCSKLKNIIFQVGHKITKKTRTTDTTQGIIELNNKWDYNNIGVDDGGLGFGVWSELINNDYTKRKTTALNNASREIDSDGRKHKRILKEEMYINLKVLMEQKKIQLFDDDEIKASLASIQHEDGKIFGSNAHITEGIIRAAWLAEKDKSLNIYVHTIKI